MFSPEKKGIFLFLFSNTAFHGVIIYFYFKHFPRKVCGKASSTLINVKVCLSEAPGQSNPLIQIWVIGKAVASQIPTVIKRPLTASNTTQTVVAFKAQSLKVREH